MDFNHRPFLNTLERSCHTWDFRTTFDKRDSFLHMLKRSAYMYKSWGPQIFRTTAGIQSGKDILGESRVVIAILNILGIKKIFCSFRLVLEGKADRELHESSRLELLENFSINKFPLSDAENNMMMMMMNCLTDWLVDRRKAFSLISSRDHCQRPSPSPISDTPRAGFETAQNLSSDFDEWRCAVAITTTPRRHWIGPLNWRWQIYFF